MAMELLKCRTIKGILYNATIYKHLQTWIHFIDIETFTLLNKQCEKLNEIPNKTWKQ